MLVHCALRTPGETLRELFGDYHWEFGLLSGADGEAVQIPAVPSCIESAFRIHVAGSLAEADVPQQVYDEPDAPGDFLLTGQELGMEAIAVTATATQRDGQSIDLPDGGTEGVPEHWHVHLTYDLADEGVTSERVSNPKITVSQR